MSNIYDVAEIVNWFQQTFRQKSYFMDKICQIFHFFNFLFLAQLRLYYVSVNQ